MQLLRTAMKATGLMLACISVAAQTYPTHPIRILATEPGSIADVAVRVIGQGISGPLGQPVVADNRAARLTGEALAKAAPDGYTLLLSGSTLWIEPLIRSDVPWNPLTDFAPVMLALSSPNVLVVHPSVKANSVKELIALALARPGELNYASGATGASSHLAPELFKSLAHVNIVRIPYKGAAPGVTALMANEAQLMIANGGSVQQQIKSGRLRALAVTSVKTSPLFPDLPTIAATVPGYEASSMLGIFAPAKTPPAIIKRLNQEIAAVLNSPDIKQKFFAEGVESVASSPEEFGTKVKSEMERLGKVIKDAGIRGD